MTTTKVNQENKLDIIYNLNLALFLIGFLSIALIKFSLINLLSFFLGATIVTLNLYWLKRLVAKVLSGVGFKKMIAIEWGAKILLIFGAISIIILKFKINILIFIFGLSILPIAVLLCSVILYFKH